MHDIRAIREDPTAFDTALARRGLPPGAARILEIDGALRASVARRQQAEARRNASSREIGIAKSGGDSERVDALKAEVAAARAVIAEAGAGEEQARAELQRVLSELPNVVQAEIPDGADENDNPERRRHGDPPRFDFEPRHHAELGANLHDARGQPCMDFEAGVRMSGSRFVLLRGVLARLERVLAQFMLDLHRGRHGYEEVAPPLLVRPEALYGSGQLPKFEDDVFACGVERYAIPTAEVSLVNTVRETLIPAQRLPLRLCASTPCFRAEAGAAGRDTRGMIRLHQFVKVELVSIVRSEDSVDELERMTGCAETVLQALELPYRVVELCAGDIGFSARRTFDLEVWMPSENRYREISSCSDCGAFQARRIGARYRPGSNAAPMFVHTLNGSALAVGRTLAALLENGQRADGSVVLPEPLADPMGCDRLLPGDATCAS